MSFSMSISQLPSTRREFLHQSAFGIGAFALASLLGQDQLLGKEEVGKTRREFTFESGKLVSLTLRPKPMP